MCYSRWLPSQEVIALSSPRSRLAVLLAASALTLTIVLTYQAPSDQPDPNPVQAAVVSDPVIFSPDVGTQKIDLVAPTTTAPPPEPVTTSTAPPPAPEPPTPVKTAEAPPVPSGGVPAIIQRAFQPYGQDAVDIALRVAKCESGYDPHALSDSGTYAGVFQVGNFWADDFARVTGQPYYDGRFDAQANARFAAWLAYEAPGGGWQHWQCY